MKHPFDSIQSEPALRGEVVDTVQGTRDEVWEEPGFAGASVPQDPDATFRAKVRRSWEKRASGAGACFSLFAGLVLSSGAFGILCSFLKESLETGKTAATGIVCFAPVVEEIGKTFIPLLTLERKPWLFSGGAAILAVCLLSGLLFAASENLLYLHVYLQAPSTGIILWRWIVCTLLHVICCGISGTGLAKVWRAASKAKSCGRIETAYPWYLAAILVHGIYNAAAILFAVWQK